MTNLGECGLVIQQEQAGTVTSAGDEPSSEISVREIVWMKRNQLKAQQLIYMHCEMRGECPHVQRSGDKRQTLFSPAAESHLR